MKKVDAANSGAADKKKEKQLAVKKDSSAKLTSGKSSEKSSKQLIPAAKKTETAPAVSHSNEIDYSLLGITDKKRQLQKAKKEKAKQKEQEKAIAETNHRLDNIGEVITLDVNSWRRDSKQLISKIATKQGGFDYLKEVNTEIYRLVEERAGVSLSTRLTNKRNRMAGEGVCKSKRDKLTKVDIISEDKKLIEIYIAIVKEMAIKYGIC